MKTETIQMTEPVEVVTWLDVSHLVTEDDTPVDNQFSEKQMRLLTRPLYASWNPGVPFVAMANVGVFFTLHGSALVPDALVSLGVESPADLSKKENRSYFLWVYGKPPDIVIEIVSNREGGELDRKLRDYAVHGVPYYVVFDPEGIVQQPALACFILERRGTDARYRPLSEPVFEGTGLGVVEWEGEFEGITTRWLRWVDAEGGLIPTGQERAEEERVRAEAERVRADALAAKLRELGVDPAEVLGR